MFASAQNFEARLFERGGDTLPYRLLLPDNYEPGKKYPLILFMHGSGERGNDNQRQLIHGSKLFLNDTLRKKFPAIVILPQCAANSRWAVMETPGGGTFNWANVQFPVDAPPTEPSALLHQLMDSLIASGGVDTKRVYVGGLSMGGMGTFDMLARYPQRFAAAFPICGAGNETVTGRYAKSTALWIFHGGADAVVPPSSSRAIYSNLKKEGADVQYTEYPGVGHNSWDKAFAEPGLFPWLFSHALK